MRWAACTTLGRALPLQLRYLFSIAAIGLVGFLFAYLVMANKERALALAPQYQQSLLAAIQRMAVYFGFEDRAHLGDPAPGPAGADRLQRMLGSLLASVARSS